jgi:hypothetical protein
MFPTYGDLFVTIDFYPAIAAVKRKIVSGFAGRALGYRILNANAGLLIPNKNSSTQK